MPSDVFASLAAALFVSHIAVSVIASSPKSGHGPGAFSDLTLFPPAWVFAIWPVIWVLQAAMLFQTYGTGFWTPVGAGWFVATCLGNAGSQLAGARRAHWAVYLACMLLMLAGSIGFLLAGEAAAGQSLTWQVSSQLYAGWASIALLVGIGVVLVCDRRRMSDRAFTAVGVAVLFAVPVGLLVLWWQTGMDYRIACVPYAWAALGIAWRRRSLAQNRAAGV